MEADQDTILWSIRQATERTSLSRSTLYRLMDDGKLTFIKVGTRRLIPNSAIATLIERTSVPSGGEDDGRWKPSSSEGSSGLAPERST